MTEDEIRHDRFLDYQVVFSSDAGKRILNDMRKSFCKRSSHEAGDPFQTAFNEGERSVVLRIEHMIEEAEKFLNAPPRPERAETEHWNLE